MHQGLLYLLMAQLSDFNLAVLLIYAEITRRFDFWLAKHPRSVIKRLLFEGRCDLIQDLVQLGTLLSRARDNKRRARLVDKDRVYFVNDGKIQAALKTVF